MRRRWSAVAERVLLDRAFGHDDIGAVRHEVTARAVAAGLAGGNALVMSTGVIGQRLPIDKIMKGIPVGVDKCGDTHQHWLDSPPSPAVFARRHQTASAMPSVAGSAPPSTLPLSILIPCTEAKV